MQSDFTLTIATQPTTWHAEFRLCDQVGNQLAYQHTDFTSLSIGEQQRLFYLRDFLECWNSPLFSWRNGKISHRSLITPS